MPSVAQRKTYSLSIRLILASVIVILITTIAAGVPAFWIISAELDDQAWHHLKDGETATQAFLQTEKERILNLTTLAAQRPRLQSLLLSGNSTALSAYLSPLMTNANLDILVVRDLAGNDIGEGTTSSNWSNLPATPGVDFYILDTSQHTLAILSSQPVFDEPSGGLIGEVTAGVILNSGFARQLASETGFDQSFVVDTQRLASSLESPPSQVDPQEFNRIINSGQGETASISIQGKPYYTALSPIRNAQRDILALNEVALPVEGMVTAKNRALLTLAYSIILVAIAGSVIGGIYARRLIAPLRTLTRAAFNISRGDLSTPVPITQGPIEISTLAAGLEESRVNTRRALDDLSTAKAWSDTLIQSVVEGIVTFDQRGSITSFSQGAERITGWHYEEALNHSVNWVLRTPEGEAQFLERVPPPGGKRQIEIVNRSERQITLAVTSARLKPPNNSGEQTALVLREITEEEALQHLRSYFLSNISHEFRTPLAALNASVELLMDEFEDLSRSEQTELLTSIHLSVTGLQTLIDNLLESASIEAGRFTIHPRTSDFSELVDEALSIMKPLLNRRQQKLRLDLRSHIPEVYVDPTRLVQVLVNLLSNASKYSPMMETLILSAAVEQNWLRVSVSDHGPGISEEDRESLFRRFVRLETEDGAQYGVGLGLSVVKAIITQHGGEVGVDPRPGGGSIFWFVIPLAGGAT
jgi:PAS domain S-box-containing protein